MATKPKKTVVQEAAKKATYKGTYKGPDEFKGNAKTIAAWKAAGKPADKSGWLKKNSSTPTPTGKIIRGGGGNTTPINKAIDAPEDYAPEPAPAPIANADGSLVDPNQWQADQARLAAAQADNDAMAAIEGEESDALLTEQAEGSQYAQQRDMQALAAKKMRTDYASVKPGQQAKLGTGLSYRGMGRGSAAKRKYKALTDEQAKTDTQINEQETKASSDYTSNIGAAAQRRAAKHAALAPRKLTLAARGAKSGVYTK